MAGAPAVVFPVYIKRLYAKSRWMRKYWAARVQNGLTITITTITAIASAGNSLAIL